MRRPAELIRKEMRVDLSKTGERVVQVVANTGGVDRENDVIAAGGWDLTAFRRNPAVLYAHDMRSLPVGRARHVEVVGGVLRAEIEAPPVKMYPFADTVWSLMDEGFLSAVSVGFRPIKWAYNEARGGFDFREQELLEISIVPVPADAGALIVGRSKAFDSWLRSGRRAVDSCPGPQGGHGCVHEPDQAIELCPASACPIRGENAVAPGGGPVGHALRGYRDDDEILHLADEEVDVDPATLGRVLAEMVGEAILAEARRAKYAMTGRLDYMSPADAVRPRGIR